MEKAICKKCVLPDSPPDITLDAEGVCNVCRAHEKSGAACSVPLLETDFVKILAQHKGKHAYDCLVMCSGGKDSTASLYYMKRRYKANPLAFMFDHGFETEDAVANVQRAVEKLGVDFLSFRSTFMHGIFSKILKTGSQAVICHLLLHLVHGPHLPHGREVRHTAHHCGLDKGPVHQPAGDVEMRLQCLGAGVPPHGAGNAPVYRRAP